MGAAPGAGSAVPAGQQRSYVTLALLTMSMLASFVDRNLLSTMFEPLAQELRLSDSQLGFLSGVAFSVCNAVFGVSMGYFADRYNRKVLMATAVALWSLFTAAQGLCTSYRQLVLMRVMVGVGEAAAGPVAHSVICDIFPRDRRAFAFSVWNTSIPAGALLGLLLGGQLTAHLGWRSAFIIVGLPGLGLSCLIATLAYEPPRGGAGEHAGLPLRGATSDGGEEDQEQVHLLLGGGGGGGGGGHDDDDDGPSSRSAAAISPPRTDGPSDGATVAAAMHAPLPAPAHVSEPCGGRVVLAAKHLLGLRLSWHLAAAKALLLLVAIGGFAWMPTMYVRRGPEYPIEAISLYLGTIVGVVGIGAQLGGGALADWCFRHSRVRSQSPLEQHPAGSSGTSSSSGGVGGVGGGGVGGGGLEWYAWVPAGVAVAATPIGLACYAVDSTPLSLLLFIGPTLASNSFDAPSSALLLGMTPPALRGTVYSLFHLAVSLVAGLGPWLVGVLSDILADDAIPVAASSSSRRQNSSEPHGGRDVGGGGGGGAHGLERALMLMQLLNLWAALHFRCAALIVRREGEARTLTLSREGLVADRDGDDDDRRDGPSRSAGKKEASDLE